MLKKAIKYFFLVFILAFLCINITQDFVKVNWQQKPLDGYFLTGAKDTFTWSKWFEGSYPEKTAKYLNEQFGFRNFLVRINNQIRFSFFKKTSVSDLIVGKENYLVQMGQLMEYNGTIFVGEKAINDTVSKLKQLQDHLQSLEKKLLIVIAPNKIRLYPEYLPDELKMGPLQKCNYEVYKKAFEKNHINFIDVNKWYAERKSTSKYLLIPQLGEHWSRLEAVVGADTILKYFARLSGKPLPQIRINKIVEKDTMEMPDDDAVKSMNLLWYPPFAKMAYPEFEIINKELAHGSLLVISDSFWWDIYQRQIPLKVFKNDEFWYYNKDAYGPRFGKAKVSEIDIKRHILQSDYVLIICTESNLSVFGFGFIGSALNELRKPTRPTPAEIADYRSSIEANSEWLKQIRDGAKEKKISLDSAIIMNIDYMFQLHGPMFKEPTVEEIVAKIKNTPEWFEQVKKGAAEKGQNLDSALIDNARYVISEGKKNK